MSNCDLVTARSADRFGRVKVGASYPRATRGYGLDSTKSISAAATVRSARCADRCDGRPKRRRQFRKTRASSYPFLADAGSCPGNCSGMEEATGAPSSLAVCDPRRLRASSRDGGVVVNQPPSPLTMLFSRHTRRRRVHIAPRRRGGVAARGARAAARDAGDRVSRIQIA